MSTTERATPTAAERSYIERTALFFEASGSTRMIGRLFAWLLICDPPQQSITDLADALTVSKASVSTVIRQMQQGHLVERIAIPGSRQHHYELRSGGWTHLMRARMSLTAMAVDAFDEGLAAVGDDPRRRDRLEEVRDFFEFVNKEFSEELFQRWEQYREQRSTERDRRQHNEYAEPHSDQADRQDELLDRLPGSLAAARKANTDPPV